MLDPVLPVTSKLKSAYCPAACTRICLSDGPPSGLPAILKLTEYRLPGVVAKLCATPPAAKYPLRSMQHNESAAAASPTEYATLSPVTTHPAIAVDPAYVMMLAVPVRGPRGPVSKLPFTMRLCGGGSGKGWVGFLSLQATTASSKTAGAIRCS